MSVSIRVERISIPTYGVGKQEKNPMFFEKRVYQGSSGKVYPYPVIDKIYDEKFDRDYTMVILENDYVQIQVMPEIGGRIYRAFDKTNGYDFVYYNRVIKPALVGLTGPWISGGIEFNWPQHHRPNTFGPVDYTIDDSNAEIKTIYLSEIDRMYGSKVTTGISLRSDSSRIEIHSELYNPTEDAQTFLWWANPAVCVHEHTRSIFPPDVHAVMDHGKRDVSRFPISTSVYYKQDYSAGVDISRYSNIPVPTSYMAYHSDYDFVGGYDDIANAGILHVADHHIAPGKKQWTWGCGEFGQAWDRNLTDEDGPYIELMTGIFTDNQPDFSWLAPYAGKNFTQYFMPYKHIPFVKSASKDFILGLHKEAGELCLEVYAARESCRVSIEVLHEGRRIWYSAQDLSPAATYKAAIPAEDALETYRVTVKAKDRTAVSYQASPAKIEQLPDPARAIGSPDTLRNTEALYLAGVHLEQYRHASFEPDQYYREGLKRDPQDIRINNAYGSLLFRRAAYEDALALFKTALDSLTRHNSNPIDGETSFNLGKVYAALGQDELAYDAYFKAAWNDAYRSQAYLKLAELSLRRAELSLALEQAETALYANYKNFSARAVLCRILLQLGEKENALRLLKETLRFDPLDFFALRELSRLGESALYPQALRLDPHNHMFLAERYAACGAYTEAITVLDDYLNQVAEPYAMVFYLKGLYALRAGGQELAQEAFALGAKAPSDYVFPNRLYEFDALTAAIACNPEDGLAHYYLGCFLYDKRRHREAAAEWEQTIKRLPEFPTAYRNLSLYRANKEQNFNAARSLMEKAFSLNPQDARILLELMDLYRRLGLSAAERLRCLSLYPDLISERDDLSVLYCELLNAAGDYEKALGILMTRHFHPWEGGEGKVPRAHIAARIGLARRALAGSLPKAAIDQLEKAKIYYENFGEGKLKGAQENNINYTLGLAYKMSGDENKAKEAFAMAATGLCEPTHALYYNDQPPHMIFYQGLALSELGREDEARSRFNCLISFGEKHLFDEQTMDYFAVSMPDFLVYERDLNEENRCHCYFMIGLGQMGLGSQGAARQAFNAALQISPNHPAVLEHLRILDEMQSGYRF